ncbi:MAG: hypothetical protein H6719_34560 [Sandaracinaceae bacterium]|nr:hypothetical protein [Sandaracinaceae bacterium]
MARLAWLSMLLCACDPAPPPDAGLDAGFDAGSPPPRLRAGVATVDITPEPGIDIVGYGTRASTSVRDPLEASVLVLRGGSARAVLVTVDLPGVADWYAEQLRGRVAIAAGVGYEDVVVAASHTHSAPLLGDDAWSARTMDAIGDAARRAAASLTPVRVGLGEGRIDFDVNRRLLVDGVVEARANPDGPRDPRVRTLVLEGDDGLVALVSHVVCHPNALLGEESTRISADFPGEARALLRARHGAPWLVVIGPAGDVRPDLRDADGAIRLADDADLARLGAELAEAVTAGVDDAVAVDGPLATTRASWTTPTRTEGARVLDLAVWRIGPVAIVTMPGEPFVEVGLATERPLLAAGAEHALVVGYANGYASYFVTPEAEALGGYEVRQSSLSAASVTAMEARAVELGASLF